MKKTITLFTVSVFLLIASCSSNKATKDQTVSSSSTSDLFGSAGSDKSEAGALETVIFEYDRAILTSNARETLKNNATWLKNNNNVFIQIEGHCDERGTIEYNLALGEKRALNVQKYLSKLGVPKKRVNIITNKNYYIIKNGKTIFKKKFA